MKHNYQLWSAYLIGAFILTLAGINICMAQSTEKRPMYRTWVELSNSEEKPTGLLYQVLDTSVIISENMIRADYNNKEIGQINIDYLQIKTIKVRRKGRVGRGMLIGAFAGAAFGVFLGSISQDDNSYIGFSREEKMWLNGIGLGTTGMILGAIIGSAKIKIPIYGSKKVFQQEKEKLKMYSFSQ